MTIETANIVDQQISQKEDEDQYLTFMLGEELYGVDILRVQEIKGYSKLTRIPNTPAFIKGVLNLRGAIVPIIDLRIKFTMEQVEYTMFTVIVVVVVRDRIMGIVVDTVSDVLFISGKDIQPPPALGKKVDVSFISGIARSGENLVTLLDIDRVLTDEEMEQVATAQE